MEPDMLILIRQVLETMPKPMLAINTMAELTQEKKEIAA